MRTVIGALCALGAALVLSLGEKALNAQQPPCDFVTGGGFIYPSGTPGGGKATFAVGGGCKNGALWGHLQYHDQTAGLTVKGTSITGYVVDAIDPARGRLICGTAEAKQSGTTTNVNFVVRVRDLAEPGSQDEFDIAVEGLVPSYSTAVMPGFPHKLGGGTKGGGNIQLHKPNSNTVMLGTCPPITGQGGENPTLTVTLSSTAGNNGFFGGTVTSTPPGIDCTIEASPGFPGPTPVVCSATFDVNEPVTLTVTSTDSSANVVIVGCDEPGQEIPHALPASCTVTMSTDKEVAVTLVTGQE